MKNEEKSVSGNAGVSLARYWGCYLWKERFFSCKIGSADWNHLLSEAHILFVLRDGLIYIVVISQCTVLENDPSFTEVFDLSH